MKTRFLIIAALFGLMILVSGCAQQPQPPADQGDKLVPPTPSKTVTVNITSEGYEPGTITINEGDTIIFTNVNDGPHWVASNPHPIHTDMRGFDARKALQPGESYSFTFTEPGTWGCHDHLDTATMCTIIVQ